MFTDGAAKELGLKPQTLRKWACEGGPIEPYQYRPGSPLIWSIDEITELKSRKRLKKKVSPIKVKEWMYD